MRQKKNIRQWRLPASFAIGVVAMLTALGNAQVQAQPNSAGRGAVVFPDGLQWQRMQLVAFNYSSGKPDSVTLRKAAQDVWGKTIEDSTGEDGRYASFVLLRHYSDDSYRYTFSILSAAHAAYPQCENPPDGGDEQTPTYSTCPLRVVIESKASGKQSSQDFPRYCAMLSLDDGEPDTLDRSEIAFDKQTHIAYFRVFQYGKLVPSCNRAVKL